MQVDRSSRRRVLHGGAAAIATLLGVGGSPAVRAQTALDILHILCGAPAGSTPDIVARRVAEQLSGRFAQRAIVENRPGASGHIAINALKAAPADGSTMLLAPGGIATVHPAMYAKLDYDPAVDLKPVSLAAEMAMGLAVGPAVPASVGNVRQLIEWMRANPKLANVGSPGNGSLPHLLEAVVFPGTEVAWQHVVYAGGPPALVDLIGGQIAVLILPEWILRQQRAAGKLRVLATSGAQRSAFFPDVPTLEEQGFPALVVYEWFAFFMSSRVSTAVVDATSQAIRSALAQPTLVAAFAESGIVAASSTPAELALRIQAEQRMWEPIIRRGNIRAE